VGKHGAFQAATVWLGFDRVVRETEKAVLIRFSRRTTTWVPSSHVASLNRDGGAIEITRWFARLRGIDRYELVPQEGP